MKASNHFGYSRWSGGALILWVLFHSRRVILLRLLRQRPTKNEFLDKLLARAWMKHFGGIIAIWFVRNGILFRVWADDQNNDLRMILRRENFSLHTKMLRLIILNESKKISTSSNNCAVLAFLVLLDIDKTLSRWWRRGHFILRNKKIDIRYMQSDKFEEIYPQKSVVHFLLRSFVSVNYQVWIIIFRINSVESIIWKINLKIRL